MPNILLPDLLRGLSDVPASWRTLSISRLTLDSRDVQPGDVFIALSGTQTDGRRFVTDALNKGAAIALVEQKNHDDHDRIIAVPDLRRHVSALAGRLYQHPSHTMTVYGITGTNGKTTTSQLLAAALTELSAPTYVVGTLGNGVYPQLQSGRHTTPDAIALQRLLAEGQSAGAKHVSMEVSSHGLDQGRVAALQFNTAIFSNLTRDHLDYHLTMEAYGEAKRQLFVWQNLQHAVINNDDAFGRQLLADDNIVAQKYAFGLRHHELPTSVPTIHADKIHYSHHGILAEVVTPWGRRLLQSPLLGEFNLSNLLAALTALCANGFALADVANAVGKVRPIAGRMERFGNATQPLVVVDYAHTPDALEKAIMALRLHCSGRVTVVFGCGGDRDKGKRPEMGRIAERLANNVIVSNDNPRSEDPQCIADDIRAGMQKRDTVFVPDREQAFRLALSQSQHGDAILLAGKGHEAYTEIAGQRLPYSEVDMVNRVLGERS